MPPNDEITNTATEVDTTEASARAGSPRLLPGSSVGRYEIGDVIGAGGVGVVYRARDPHLKRDVAIKVVGAHGGRSQERLLTEARAMAKLDHPCVAPVFDVGTIHDGVYVVMPFLRGGTLQDWIHGGRHSWREVVARFVKAGRGLAAAHAAGLIHRDFKPRNVLLDGADVLVADFGLVADSASEESGPSPEASTLGGTPGYMAPEQARGDHIDARADQFSFCVSLWEGLHGERPNDAATRTQGTLPAVAVPPPPERRDDSPAWLRRVVAKGFATLPEDRWPSMERLLATLEARAARPRKFAVAAAIASVLLAASFFLWLRKGDHADAACADAGRAAEAWTKKDKTEIATRFLGSKRPYAQATLDRIIPQLDEYAESWRSLRIATCSARTDRSSPSVASYDATMNCLDRRLAAFVNTVAVFRSADDAIIRKAIDTVGRLPAIRDCGDNRLASEFALPTSGVQREKVKALETALDESWTLRLQGKRRERLVLLQRLVTEARDVGHDPLYARALFSLAREESDAGIDPEAHFREVIEVASRAHDDTRVARAWALLTMQLTEDSGRISDAAALVPVMEAAATRAGSPSVVVVEVNQSIASIAGRTGNTDRALAHLERALGSVDTEGDRLGVLQNIIAINYMAGRGTAAVAAAEDLAKRTESLYGKDHPQLAEAFLSLGKTVATTGDLVREEQLFQRALDINRHAFGDNDITVAAVLISLGNLQRITERAADAESSLQEAVKILESKDDRVQQALATSALADAIRANRGFPAARETFQRGLQLAEQVGGKDNLRYVMAETNFAVALLENGDCASAKPYLDHSIRFLEGIKHPGVAISLGNQAKCDLLAGRRAPALAALERAIELCRPGGCPATTLEGAMELLSVELLKDRGTTARGLALAAEVRASYERNGRKVALEKFEKTLARAQGTRIR